MDKYIYTYLILGVILVLSVITVVKLYSVKNQTSTHMNTPNLGNNTSDPSFPSVIYKKLKDGTKYLVTNKFIYENGKSVAIVFEGSHPSVIITDTTFTFKDIPNGKHSLSVTNDGWSFNANNTKYFLTTWGKYTSDHNMKLNGQPNYQ